MKLQILIPRYNESPEVIKPLFDSIALQQSVDFNEIGAIVCDDGSEESLPDDFFDSYPYEIKYISIPHGGVSAARQACLDEATADYIMYSDADDMFMSVAGLWLILREIEKEEFDMMISAFTEEVKYPNGEFDYINHNQDTTFVHGKVFRRDFLIENNICWDKSLTVHEDSYFCNLARECIPEKKRGKYNPTSFFLWRWRDNSVCRESKNYILSTYPNMLESSSALVCQMIERGKTESAQFYVANMVFDAYYSMNRKDFLNIDNKDYKRKVEERFKEYYSEFSDLFFAMDENDRNAISNSVRTRMIQEGMMNQEIITLGEFLSQFET